MIKFFEIRDRATYIPVMATKIVSSDQNELRLLHSAGFSIIDIVSGTFILLTRLSSGESNWDYYNWGNTRTMPNAHKHIAENFDNLISGDVIDVEFILGETKTCKEPQ